MLSTDAKFQDKKNSLWRKQSTIPAQDTGPYTGTLINVTDKLKNLMEKVVKMQELIGNFRRKMG
jgi:hypothetical protein